MTLADVHQTRTEFGHVSKPPTTCLIGVPYSQRHWLDHEVWAWDGQRVYGPMLVVDIEADHHHPYMWENGLAADVNCSTLVHKQVILYARRVN
jgi:hypothetical protein